MHWLFLVMANIFFMFSDVAEKPAAKMNWVPIDSLSVIMQQQPRPVLFSIYTDWCGWCKKMDRTTYRNAKLIQYINEYYYPVKFNGEYKEPVEFNGQIFRYNSENNIHELTLYLTRNEPAFPVTVFLSHLSANPAPLAGYLNAKEMEAPLKYFVEKPDMSFEDYLKLFKPEW